MKITAFLLFVAFMQVSAATFAQKVTLQKKDVTLKELFKEINKQTGYNVFAADDLIKNIKAQDLNFKETNLLEVLNIALQNTLLTYTITYKTIVITQKKETPKPTPPSAGQSITISGQVKDETGQPIPGVNIKVKGTDIGTTTDVKGLYALNVPDENLPSTTPTSATKPRNSSPKTHPSEPPSS